MPVIVCVDVGSTYTKAGLVDTDHGTLLAGDQEPTTIDTDVWNGVLVLLDRLAARVPAAAGAEVRASSSAGGGLRLAVVGYERVVTAEAGRMAGLSAGARVVHVHAGRLDAQGIAGLRAAEPDIVLLAGGTDGGNADVLVHNATTLAATGTSAGAGGGAGDGGGAGPPVVVAGNAEAGQTVTRLLHDAGRTAVLTANVLPRIGLLDPQPARAAIRDVFVEHVIGGGRLSRDPRFAAAVRGATPDVVLTGVEVLSGMIPATGGPATGGPATGGPADVLVVDVGGATTDVYSVLEPDAEDNGLGGQVVGTAWHGRTVEGDLGTRWSAPGVIAAALAERLIDEPEAASLLPAAESRAAADWQDPSDGSGDAVALRMARMAITVALRRHARPVVPGAAGRDLRRVRLVVGSGGALRRAGPVRGSQPLVESCADYGGGWRVPERPRYVIDADYRLAAAGLLADDYPAAAVGLLTALLDPAAAHPAAG